MDGQKWIICSGLSVKMMVLSVFFICGVAIRICYFSIWSDLHASLELDVWKCIHSVMEIIIKYYYVNCVIDKIAIPQLGLNFVESSRYPEIASE